MKTTISPVSSVTTANLGNLGNIVDPVNINHPSHLVNPTKTCFNTVTVIGVTGTMGANVAGIFASFGNAKVYCVGRDLEKVKRTLPRIVKSVRADAIAHNLIPADFSMLEDCVSKSDLIFESSKEDINVKSEIAQRVGEVLRPEAIACTGTSGLSITEIAKHYPEHLRGHFFGVHMFNPPYSMSLCELTSTPFSDISLKEQLKSYLSQKLYRTVVEVKDSPAFLANRIGFQFINKALLYAEKFKDNGGIDYIDAILGPFTGRSMAPLITSDFVGLDVHRAIVDNLYENTNDYVHATFVLPNFAQKLIKSNNLGRKSGKGLYQLIKYENGLKRQTVFDISSGVYRDVIPYVFPFADKMKEHIAEGDYKEAFKSLLNNHSQEAEICLSFLIKYIIYALYTANEVGYNLEALESLGTAADDVMATGFKWCPPFALYQALNTVVDVPSLIKERFPELENKVDIKHLLSHVIPSKYDYRPYFKSSKLGR